MYQNNSIKPHVYYSEIISISFTNFITTKYPIRQSKQSFFVSMVKELLFPHCRQYSGAQRKETISLCSLKGGEQHSWSVVITRKINYLFPKPQEEQRRALGGAPEVRRCEVQSARGYPWGCPLLFPFKLGEGSWIIPLQHKQLKYI